MEKKKSINPFFIFLGFVVALIILGGIIFILVSQPFSSTSTNDSEQTPQENTQTDNSNSGQDSTTSTGLKTFENDIVSFSYPESFTETTLGTYTVVFAGNPTEILSAAYAPFFGFFTIDYNEEELAFDESITSESCNQIESQFIQDTTLSFKDRSLISQSISEVDGRNACTFEYDGFIEDEGNRINVFLTLRVFRNNNTVFGILYLTNEQKEYVTDFETIIDSISLK